MRPRSRSGARPSTLGRGLLFFALLSLLPLLAPVSLGAQTLPGSPTGAPAEEVSEASEEAPEAVAAREVPAARASARATMMSFLEGFYEDGGIERSVAALDLSNVPTALRELRGPELAFQLKEVLDRTRLIEPEEIPDDPEGAPYVFLDLPEGRVTIDRGPGGEWRFTPETVAAVPALYLALEDEEVVEGVAVRATAEALSPGLWMREKMPRSLQRTVFVLEHWQWLGLLVLVLLGVVVDRLAVAVAHGLVGRWLRRRVETIDHAALAKTLRPLGLVAMALVWSAGLRFLWLPLEILTILEVAVRFVAAAGGVWAAYRLVDIVSALLEERARRTDNRFDDLLVPLVRKSLKVFVFAIGLVFIADTLELDVSSLLAGLGLGGLAVALAAQDAVKNLFGSLMVLLDRPFAVGDWVVVEGQEGTVEEVGFRSTRIRTFYNSLITLPNANLIDSAVDNYGARRYRRWKGTLSLTYGTPPEQVEAFCEGVRELVRQHPGTRKDYFHIYLNGFGESSIDILLYVFFDVADWGLELAARHELALDILRLADRLGVSFAFPTRTVWLEQGAAEPDGAHGADRRRGRDTHGDPLELGRAAAGEIAVRYSAASRNG